MTIYGNENMVNSPVQMRLWQASTGKIFILNAAQDLLFTHKRCYGCAPDVPIVLTTSDRKIQQLMLSEGWNWVSFHLNPTYSTNINRMLSAQAQWTAGDLVKDPLGRMYSQYQTAIAGKPAAWYGTLNRFNYRCIYMFSVQNALTPEIEGEPLTEQDRTLRLFAGWNVLPYLLETNLPVTEAMADYLNNAKEGDVIKSKDRFAVFSAASKWEGNLTYMEPGQGYLLYRQGEPCTFTYYTYNITPHPRNAHANAVQTPLFVNHAATNMNVIATLADYHGSTDGLTLSAYAGNELAGRVAVHNTDSMPLFFLTIGSENPAPIRFALEQNGKTIATGAPLFDYEANRIVGSLAHPLPVAFGGNSIVAYPSPFVDKVQIIVTAESEQPVSVAIYSAGGQLITQVDGQTENGTYIYDWQQATDVPAGIYSAVVRTGKHTQTVKLIKQK